MNKMTQKGTGLASLCLAVFVALSAPAHAQKEHVEHYLQYTAALEAGDMASAATSAEAAWRAAETELGDNQTTAILAYNYASMVYYSTPQKAIEPLERVVALTSEAADIFDAETPALMLSFAKAVTENDDKNLKSDLRAQLEANDDASPEKAILSARGWLHIASYEIGRKKYKAAEDAASASLAHYEEFREQAPLEMANAFLARGVSKIVGTRRDNDDIISANSDFRAAVQLFPPQKDIETFYPALAAAVAWDAASRSAAVSDNPKRPRIGSRITTDPPKLDPIDEITWTTPHPTYEECQFDWAKRKQPKFPQADVERGMIGAVLVGYHFDGTSISDTKIMAEVPQKSSFGEITLKAVQNWELAAEPSEDCARNRLTTILFVIGG